MLRESKRLYQHNAIDFALYRDIDGNYATILKYTMHERFSEELQELRIKREIESSCTILLN